MKEIIYIQAGNISNHIGSHFWNTQESYFTYGEGADDPIVDHNVSFREGLSTQATNFGPLSKYNELYPDTTGPDRSILGPAWNGTVAEYKQDPIIKSEYQKRLDAGEPEDDEERPTYGLKSEEVRFWSDYNRVYYHPRSLHALSDLPEWEANRGNWNFGKNVFERYEAENQLSEIDFRHFVEECDNFQGFQMTFDNTSFGAFSVSVLEMIRDEFPKVPVLAFPVLSGLDPSKVDMEEIQLRKSIFLDAICLQSLNELATQTVPIQSPSSWQLGRWSEHIDVDTKCLYETSAILSAHIETATLPLRLKYKADDLTNLCQHLNWSQNSHFSHLSGVLPFIDGDDLDVHYHDFSAILAPATNHDVQILAQRNITRGLSAAQMHKVGDFYAKSGLNSPYLTNLHSISYPLPTSYPHFFLPLPSLTSNSTSPPPQKRAKPTPTPTSLPRRKSTSLLSSLTTTPSTGALFKSYAQFLGECIRKRVGVGEGGGVGLDADDLKEVRDALWAVADAYLGSSEAEGGADAEDEEGDVSMGESEGLDIE